MRFLQGRGRPLAGIFTIAALAAGCSSPTRLHVDDGSTPVGSFRAVHRFGGASSGGGGLEIDVQSVRGQASQALASTESAQLGDQALQGPAQLLHTAEAQHVQLAYNRRLFVDSPVELEWFAGVAAHQLRWHTTGGGAPADGARFKNSWYGPAGGVMARFKLGSAAAVELRYAAAVELSSLDGSRTSVELAFAFSPVQQMQLRLGFADARSSHDADSATSDLRLRARGPFAGLAFAF